MNPSYLIFCHGAGGWRSSPLGGTFTGNANDAWRFTRAEAIDYCFRVRNRYGIHIPVREQDAIDAGLKKETT